MTNSTKELINYLARNNFDVRESGLGKFIKDKKEEIKNFKPIYQKTYWDTDDDGDYMPLYEKYLFKVHLIDGTIHSIPNVYCNN